jgi:phage shock protein A
VSVVGRIKRVLAARANALIDKASSPEKELEIAIAELEQANLEARKELLSYRTTAKQIERDIEVLDRKITSWQERAVTAVKAGDDALAKDALREKQRCVAERLQRVRDRDEASSYAIELNTSRKQVEQRLRALKLKKGTMAQQIKAARGGGDAFGTGEVWERMEKAEQAIEEQAIAAEVEQMLGTELGATELAASLDRQAMSSDAALAELKAKMAGERERKQLAPNRTDDGSDDDR